MHFWHNHGSDVPFCGHHTRKYLILICLVMGDVNFHLESEPLTECCFRRDSRNGSSFFSLSVSSVASRMREQLRHRVKCGQPKNIPQVGDIFAKVRKKYLPHLCFFKCYKNKTSKIQPSVSETWASDCKMIRVLPLGEFSFYELQGSLSKIILKKT